MTATRPAIVTATFAAAITEATVDLADRIRAVVGDTSRRDSDTDQASTLATDFITSLCRRGWRPTNATVIPDWRPGRRQSADVARRGAASARALLSDAAHDAGNTEATIAGPR